MLLNKMKKVSLVSLVAFAVGGVGCLPAGPDIEAAAKKSDKERMIDAMLSYFQKCFLGDSFMSEAEPRYMKELFNEAEYRKAMEKSYEDSLANPNVDLDKAAQKNCLEWLEGNPECLQVPENGCDDFFIGKLAAGEDCAENVECQGELYCRGLTGESCGVCGAKATLGESCEEADCMDPYLCNRSLSPHSCAEPAALGESCQEVDCADGLECDYQNGVVCIREEPDPTYQAGDTCDPSDGKCGSWGLTGLACKDDDDDGSGVCTQVTIVGEGQACEILPNGELIVACRNGILTTHYCDADISQGSFSGTCRERPSVGDACTPLFRYCNALESHCDSSDQCVANIPVGGTCDPQGEHDICGLARCDYDSLTCEPTVFLDDDEPPVCE